MHILSGVSFEWDEDKRRLNLRDALSAFEDEEALTLPDDATDGEDRFVTLGRDLFGRLLVVAYT